MPTIFREGPYRFFFFSGDGTEPAHIHVERDFNIAKVWLDPVRLCKSGGFKRSEINTILFIVGKNQNLLMEAWNEYFGN